MKMRVITLLFVPAAFGMAFGAAATAPATAPARTAWDGIYNNDQLERGKKAYNTFCLRCHGDTLLGNDDAPALVGKDFLERWNAKTVGKMVELTQKTMPSDGPGKLSRKQCTDMVVYLLNANGFPAGNSELASDADVLNAIEIRAKK